MQLPEQFGIRIVHVTSILLFISANAHNWRPVDASSSSAAKPAPPGAKALRQDRQEKNAHSV
jgi:hypothetical protein